MTNFEAYRNYTQRMEELITKRFWLWLAVFASFTVILSFLPIPFIIRTILGIMVLVSLFICWQLYADFFESKQEIRVVFSVYAIFQLMLSVGLGISIWYTMT